MLRNSDALRYGILAIRKLDINRSLEHRWVAMHDKAHCATLHLSTTCCRQLYPITLLRDIHHICKVALKGYSNLCCTTLNNILLVNIQKTLVSALNDNNHNLALAMFNHNLGTTLIDSLILGNIQKQQLTRWVVLNIGNSNPVAALLNNNLILHICIYHNLESSSCNGNFVLLNCNIKALSLLCNGDIAVDACTSDCNNLLTWLESAICLDDKRQVTLLKTSCYRGYIDPLATLWDNNLTIDIRLIAKVYLATIYRSLDLIAIENDLIHLRLSNCIGYRHLLVTNLNNLNQSATLVVCIIWCYHKHSRLGTQCTCRLL